MMQHKDIEIIARTFHGYKTAMAKAFAQAGLSGPVVHIKVLRLIQNLAPCTSQEIAANLDRDKAQVTRLLKDMTAQGLVVKSDNPNDKRSHFLQITSHGESTLQTMEGVERKILEKISLQVSDAELTQMRATLSKILTAIDVG